jgi:hypothetical protein
MDSEFSKVGLLNDAEAVINPATEEKQDDILVSLRQVPTGATSHGQITLSTAWQAVPSSPPADDYVITFDKEDVEGTVRWSYDNTGTPGTAVGLQLRGNPASFQVEGGTSIYISSSDATDLINYTYKVI